jgi:hypothetical protein
LVIPESSTMNTTTRDQVEVPGEPGRSDAAALLRQKSLDLAQQDGRSEAREEDRENALHELTSPDSGEEIAPEIPPGAEELVTWDASPGEAGKAIPESISEDEADVFAEQAEEGLGEAEQELRRAAETKAHPHSAPKGPG